LSVNFVAILRRFVFGQSGGEAQNIFFLLERALIPLPIADTGLIERAIRSLKNRISFLSNPHDGWQIER
jgi:hypothetical protein